MAFISTRPFVFPRRNEPCLCQSGKSFKTCCGSLAVDRQPPVGMFVVRNAVPMRVCEEIVDIGETNRKDWLTTGKPDPASGKLLLVKDENRVTQGVDLSGSHQMIKTLVKNLWQEIIGPTCGATIEWFEQPGLLRYTPGGHYFTHADAEQFNPRSGHWDRVLERDLSMLLYVNSEFEGGYLNFPNFNYRHKPKQGDLVFFPADHRFTHKAETVSAGVRYAIVSWGAIKGGVRCLDKPPANAILV